MSSRVAYRLRAALTFSVVGLSAIVVALLLSALVYLVYSNGASGQLVQYLFLGACLPADVLAGYGIQLFLAQWLGVFAAYVVWSERTKPQRPALSAVKAIGLMYAANVLIASVLSVPPLTFHSTGGIHF